MNCFSIILRIARLVLRPAAWAFSLLSIGSAFFYCSCQTGSFYALNSADYMVEHCMDYPAIITSEGAFKPESYIKLWVPVYKVQDRYYVKGENVMMGENVPLLFYVGEQYPTPYYLHRRTEQTGYYEVKLDSSGENRIVFVANDVDSSHPMQFPQTKESCTPVGYYGVYSGSYTCGKDGMIQGTLVTDLGKGTWRSMYGLPTAAVLFVAVDLPFDLISFSGYCISSFFEFFL